MNVNVTFAVLAAKRQVLVARQLTHLHKSECFCRNVHVIVIIMCMYYALIPSLAGNNLKLLHGY